ncbi:MAG: hypothetical protein WCA49_05755 [Candidatus Sulfotelmatobacter sp.]
MGLEDVPRCQHVKVNGTQCGSPALRRRRRCYFHEGARIEREKFVADQFAQRRFVLPLLEDANGVQLALMQVLQLLGSGRMDHKTAGLMLYGLQTASANLRHTKFEAEKPTEVVIDRNTVDQTCLNGPQWFARDFADTSEEGENSGAAAASGEPEPAEAGQGESGRVQASRAPVGPVKVRTDKRKRPERAGIEEAPDWARNLMQNLLSRLGGAEASIAPG